MTLAIDKIVSLPHVGTLPDEFTVLPNQSDLNCSAYWAVGHCVLEEAIGRTLFDAGVAYKWISVTRTTADIELPYGGFAEYDHNGGDIVTAFDNQEPITLHPIRLRRHQYDKPAAA